MNLPLNRREIPAMLLASTLGGVTIFGCHTSPPSGVPIAPLPLGSIVDQVNQTQEDNAEAAKFIVYMHEFELNVPFSISRELASTDEFRDVPREFARGFRLTPYGQDHVRQIARYLRRTANEADDGTVSYPTNVVVERSNTSKRWLTKFRYPVHWNTELDEFRRKLIVESLLALDVQEADYIVQIAPAFPEGLHSQEAASAYSSSRSSGGRNRGAGGQGGQGSGGFGGGFGGGIGGGFGSGFGGGGNGSDSNYGGDYY